MMVGLIPRAHWSLFLSDKLADWQLFAVAGGEPLLKDARVLNLGPGYGLEEFVLARHAKEWIALDSSLWVLERARVLEPKILTRVTMLPELPADLGEFDLVLDFSTLDDIAEPLAGYRAVARLLRPGGRLVTTYANRRKTQPGTEPEDLAVAMASCGLDVLYRTYEDQARAGMIAQRPSEETVQRRNGG
jgi:SAM-dependent methyltransferase